MIRRSISYLLLLWLCPTYSLALTNSNTTEAALYFQVNNIDLDFAGDIRKSRFSSLDLMIREQLSADIDGALWLGYLETTQDTNPILAGQDMGGEYVGIDFRFHHIQTPRYQLHTRFFYRYANTEDTVNNQTVKWEWHQVSLGLHNRLQVGNTTALTVGLSGIAIDGREKAEGTLNQRLSFDADVPYQADLGLEFRLDHTGDIGIELHFGSLRGGQLTFKRQF